MTASIARLRTKPDRLRGEAAEEIRQRILALEEILGATPAGKRLIGEFLVSLDRLTIAEPGFVFVMINARQFDAVLEHLLERARSPRVAAKVWSKCFTDLRRDTGEVMLSRDEIASRVGAPADEVSRVLALLVEIGALIKLREKGGIARYFVNPLIGTHLAGKDRDRAQAEAPPVNLPHIVA